MIFNKNYIIEKCKEKMPQMDIRQVKIRKNNDMVYEGIKVKPVDGNCGIVIYWKTLEVQCGINATSEEIISKIVGLVDVYLQAVGTDKDKIVDWDWVKSRIYKKVVNYEQNREQLKTVAYRKYLDLAEAYYIKLNMGRHGDAFCKVTLNMMNVWNVTEEELHWQADLNMPKEMYSVKKTCRVLESKGVDVKNKIFSLYVLTNKAKRYGAAAISSVGALKIAMEEIGENCYILPYSVDELFLVPMKHIVDSSVLKGWIKAINRILVSQDLYLSDNVYRLNWEKECVEIC